MLVSYCDYSEAEIGEVAHGTQWQGLVFSGGFVIGSCRQPGDLP